jgi:hypothetical protein
MPSCSEFVTRFTYLRTRVERTFTLSVPLEQAVHVSVNFPQKDFITLLVFPHGTTPRRQTHGQGHSIRVAPVRAGNLSEALEPGPRKQHAGNGPRWGSSPAVSDQGLQGPGREVAKAGHSPLGAL